MQNPPNIGNSIIFFLGGGTSNNFKMVDKHSVLFGFFFSLYGGSNTFSLFFFKPMTLLPFFQSVKKNCNFASFCMRLIVDHHKYGMISLC